MIRHINVDIIKTVIISIIVNNVARTESTDISSEDDKLFDINEDQDGIHIYKNHPTYVKKKVVVQSQDDENEGDIKTLLEQKYKFRNDETSTRFKVAREDKGDFPGLFIDSTLKGEKLK